MEDAAEWTVLTSKQEVLFHFSIYLHLRENNWLISSFKYKWSQYAQPVLKIRHEQFCPHCIYEYYIIFLINSEYLAKHHLI